MALFSLTVPTYHTASQSELQTQMRDDACGGTILPTNKTCVVVYRTVYPVQGATVKWTPLVGFGVVPGHGDDPCQRNSAPGTHWTEKVLL
jgi:hypothetical protein